MSECHDVTALRYWLRHYFEVYDRPCEPNGNWPHGDEYSVIDALLREMVGAPAAKVTS